MRAFNLALVCLQIAAGQTAGNRHLGVVTPRDANPVHVVAFGDWGYRGSDSGQDAVARAVGKAHAARPFHLGLTLGDNFYPSGVASVNDPLWEDLWEQGYHQLRIPFFASLGNHDYEGNEQAEIEYTRRSTTWRMPFNYYTFVAGPIQFFALDTDEGTAGRLFFRQQWSDAQAKWLDTELSRSPAPWKIVYGHHPIFSDGHHGDDKRLIAKLLPILKAHRADLYLAGHEHEMQVHVQDGISFIIAGGGGKDLRKVAGKRTEFSASQHGFLEISASPAKLEWQLVSTEGKTLRYQALARPAPANLPERTRTAPVSQPR